MPSSTFLSAACSPAQPAGLPAQPELQQAPAGQRRRVLLRVHQQQMLSQTIGLALLEQHLGIAWLVCWASADQYSGL